MRYIDPNLEAKLKLAMQTAYNDAQPKMEVYLGQAGDLLSALARFRVLTIREAPNLGKLDIGVKRPDKDMRPTEMHIAYIQDGVAKVCYQPMPITAGAEWIELYTVGEAVDVALEFDGRWVKHEGGLGSYTYNDPMRFLLQTDGDPWVFWVTAAGALYGKQGASGQVVEIAPDGVTGVSAVRGWKNLEIGDIDQGLIVAYIRAGQVCYRNYAEQADGQIIWEIEQAVTQIPTGAAWVTTYNTHDFRTGLAAEVSGTVHYVLTDRAWALMAIDDEHVSARVTDLKFELLPITYCDTHHTEHISARVTDLSLALIYGGAIWAIAAYNSNDQTIILTFNHDLTVANGQQAALTFMDSNGRTWQVVGTAAGPGTNQMTVSMSEFNNAVGDVTISYVASLGTMAGNIGQTVGDWSISFLPTGLVPYAETSPVPTSAYNVP